MGPTQLIIWIMLIGGAVIAFRLYKKKNKEDAANRFRSKWNSRREFFRVARDDADYLLEWWQRYSNSAPDTGTPPLPALLRRARRQAEQGLHMMSSMQNGVDNLTSTRDLTQEENIAVADRYMNAVLITQDMQHRNNNEDISDYSDLLPEDIPESVLDILDQAAGRLNKVQGWGGYKEKFFEGGNRVINLLDSPSYNVRAQEYLEQMRRFPDPNQMQPQYVESPTDRIEKRMDRWETVAGLAALAYMFNQQNNK